jgi:hypothetical protein
MIITKPTRVFPIDVPRRAKQPSGPYNITIRTSS